MHNKNGEVQTTEDTLCQYFRVWHASADIIHDNITLNADITFYSTNMYI